MSRPLDRTFDACLNRASEGLRVLMDTARFEFDHPGLSDRYKDLRHRLIRLFSPAESGSPVESRGCERDVSRPTEDSPFSPSYLDLWGFIEANNRLVQEALRTLEEFSRLTDCVHARSIETFR